MYLPFVVGLVAIGFAAALRRSRVRPGFCVVCGYSLRGLPSPVRCPECGRAEAAASVHVRDVGLEARQFILLTLPALLTAAIAVVITIQLRDGEDMVAVAAIEAAPALLLGVAGAFFCRSRRTWPTVAAITGTLTLLLDLLLFVPLWNYWTKPPDYYDSMYPLTDVVSPSFGASLVLLAMLLAALVVFVWVARTRGPKPG